MLIGGLGLLWIACKLILDTGESKEHDIRVTTFWGAMKTIIVADALMGIDNVLGVTGCLRCPTAAKSLRYCPKGPLQYPIAC